MRNGVEAVVVVRLNPVFPLCIQQEVLCLAVLAVVAVVTLLVVVVPAKVVVVVQINMPLAVVRLAGTKL
jgi:hypothetical protein